MTLAPQCPRCGVPAQPDSRFCNACGAALRETDLVDSETGHHTPSDPLIGHTLLDRYLILRAIGQGGMGRVYLAEQRVGRSTRNVAVKLLAPSVAGNATVVERFHREASTILQLTHPCTVRLYDFGEDAGRLFLVMEYVAGERLADALARGPLPLARVAAIVVQIGGSLDEAHRLGVVHRDLKPENVILTDSGGSQLVKVVDFGVAKNVEHEMNNPSITVRGMLIGTPAYMSPEQFADIPADARSDVYALGMMTYRMLAGALPWSVKNVYEWATCHVRSPVPRLETRAPGLPPRVYAAVHRALEKSPSDRFASAGEFARELSGLTAGVDAWTAIATGELAISDARPATGTRAAVRTGAMETLSASTPPSLRRRHWAVLAALFVFALGSGFGVVAVMERRTVRRVIARTAPIVVTDSGPAVDAGPQEADVPELGASHPNWPRALEALTRGLARAHADDLDGAIEALDTAQDLIGPTSQKLNDLRDATARLGERLIRTDLTAHRCTAAEALVRRLRHVGAEEGAFRLFGRHCPAP